MLVGSATLSQLATALDASSGYVMISGHSPLIGAGWTEALVPLTSEEALRPSRLRVSGLQFDALVNTGGFLAMVDRLDHFGGLVRQFAKPPRADVNFDDSRAEVRMAVTKPLDYCWDSICRTHAKTP